MGTKKELWYLRKELKTCKDLEESSTESQSSDLKIL